MFDVGVNTAIANLGKGSDFWVKNQRFNYYKSEKMESPILIDGTFSGIDKRFIFYQCIICNGHIYPNNILCNALLQIR